MHKPRNCVLGVKSVVVNFVAGLTGAGTYTLFAPKEATFNLHQIVGRLLVVNSIISTTIQFGRNSVDAVATANHFGSVVIGAAVGTIGSLVTVTPSNIILLPGEDFTITTSAPGDQAGRWVFSAVFIPVGNSVANRSAYPAGMPKGALNS